MRKGPRDQKWEKVRQTDNEKRFARLTMRKGSRIVIIITYEYVFFIIMSMYVINSGRVQWRSEGLIGSWPNS